MEKLKATKALGAMRNLAYCMEKAIHNGFTANFNVMDGLLHHADSGKSYQPEQVHVVDFFRFEGVSDPDDNDYAESDSSDSNFFISIHYLAKCNNYHYNGVFM